MNNIVLNNPSSWKPLQNSRLEHITIDLLERRNLSGLILQGGGRQSWVESVVIRYSAEGDTPSWSTILDAEGDPVIFAANIDDSTHRLVDFGRIIGARHLRVVPWQWHQSISMRMEVIGCFQPYPTLPAETSTVTLPVTTTTLPAETSTVTLPVTTTTLPVTTTTLPGMTTTLPVSTTILPVTTTTLPVTTTTLPVTTTTLPVMTTTLPEMCTPCPNLNVSHIALDRCACPSGLLWDGSGCVAPNKCPCYEDGIKYEIGAVFQRNSDCSICVCQLSRIVHCRPKDCPSCPDGLQSISTPGLECGCQCVPCPSGTRLCPTSNVCIQTSLWCNGVEDCPDDERDCKPGDL